MWCSPDGDDVTGNGTKDLPYATIEHAISLFSNGDQIRLLAGTYTPTDSVIISGVEGSLFSEDPKGAYIQPQKCTVHQAGVAILSSPRFTVQGIVVLQAADATGNLIGIYADVEHFICLTCSVTSFDVPSGVAVGIFATGLLGRVEDCTVQDFTCSGPAMYGIRTIGIPAIDCHVHNLSGVSSCDVFGIDEDGQYIW
jgi:hypothetical protein